MATNSCLLVPNSLLIGSFTPIHSTDLSSVDCCRGTASCAGADPGGGALGAEDPPSYLGFT